jgi:hypothetical protein
LTIRSQLGAGDGKGGAERVETCGRARATQTAVRRDVKLNESQGAVHVQRVV